MAFFANLQARAYRIWRNLPLLPLTALCLLLGLSIYASLQGGSSGPSTIADAAPEIARSHTSVNGEARSPRAGIAQAAVANASCSLQNATYAGRILKSGGLNIKPSSEACWKECKHTEKCNAWTWCADELGCMDENGRLMPYKGCQLKDEPMQAWGLPSQRQVASHKIANHFSGYLRHRKPHQRTFIRLHSAPLTTLMVATYVPPAACSADKGDLFTLLGIMNKQDYARWHSCEFVLGAKTFDPSLRPPGHPEEGTWNKVGMLRKLLEDTPPRRAEWILFMQPDAIIDDTSFTFPFESYRNKDFILLGNATQLRNGQFRSADLGVFVLRNSRWTRRLLDMLAEEARNHPTTARALREDVGLDPVAAALARLIQRMPDRLLPKMHFEGDFCIGCDWRRINLTESSKVETTKEWGEDNKRWNLFITRFYDCELCDAGRTKEPLSKCHKSYLEHYDFAFCRFHRLIKAIHREEETGHPLKMMINDLGIPKASLNESSFDWPVRHNTVLKHAAHFHTLTDHECWEACVMEEQCSMWVWCNYRNGCDDNGNFDGTFPYRGCQLMSLEKGIPVQQWYRGPQFSSVMSGFITDKHPARSWVNKRLGLPGSSKERIVVLTGIHPIPCTTPFGDFFMSLQLQNKQDWARLRSYEVHQMAELVDSHMRPGPWQKVGMIRKALLSIPRERAEWILWLDMDMVLENITFTLPLDSYAGKDFILWGQPEWIMKGHNAKGLNTGSVLIRNTEWSRTLIADMATYGKYPVDWSKEEMLRAAVPSYDIGMYEQNMLVWRLMNEPDIMAKMHFEHGFCINCWYKDLDSPQVKHPPFVVHFAGCQMCTGYHPEKLGECATEFVRSYAEALVRLNDEVAKGNL